MSETFNVEVIQQDPVKVTVEERPYTVLVDEHDANNIVVEMPGPQGAIGPPGPTGATGPTGPMPTRFTFVQPTPSTEWVINHSLNGQPIASVVDFSGTQVFGDVMYTSPTQIVIQFTAPLSGTANFI